MNKLAPASDFNKGREAYYNSNDAAYFAGSDELREGYEDAWYENEGKKYEKWGDEAPTQAFEKWIAQIESETVVPSDISFEPHVRFHVGGGAR